MPGCSGRQAWGGFSSGMKIEKILREKKQSRIYLRDMLFQGNELAVTHGGRSAQKVSFWITYSSHTNRVWKWPLKELHMVMSEANALGVSSIKYSQKWGGKRSRQAHEVPDAQQIDSDEHQMPLRDASEVQMKPCLAKTHCTKLQMDDRTSAEGCRYLLPGFTAQRQLSSAGSNHRARQSYVGLCCQGGWGGTGQLPSTALLLKDTDYNTRELWKQSIKLDRTSKGSWAKAQKTTDH